MVAMWKREEEGGPPDVKVDRQLGTEPASGRSEGPRVDRNRTASTGPAIVTIGKSIVVKGELSGKEDLTIEGRVEGKVDLSEHVLTIGPHAKLKAQLSAKSIVVIGQVTGNIAASDRINIREEGSVEGDIAAPRVAIAEGATFRGSIDMRRQGGQGGQSGQSGKTGGGGGQRTEVVDHRSASDASSAGSRGRGVTRT